MKKLFFVLALFFSFSISLLQADDNIDKLVSQFPTIITHYTSLGTPAPEKKITWSRTDMLEMFSINQMTCKESLLLVKNSPVAFLTPEKSGAELIDYYGRITKFPLIIYKWDFEVDNDGLYLLTIPVDLGTYGYLNNELVIVISNSALSKKGTSKQWVSLLKGKNTLFVVTKPGSSNQLKITLPTDIDRVKNEIAKKVTSTNKDDFAWVTTNFIPFLLTIRNGIYPYIIEELVRINKAKPFLNNEETVNLLKSFLVQNNFDTYMIEKFIYNTFPDIYFPKTTIKNSFVVNGNEPRTTFYKQLMYDGQKDLASKYFTQCIEAITNNKDLQNKEKIIAAFYKDQFICFYRNGRIREANDVLKITQEKCKPFPLPNYIDGRPEQEDVVTLTQSFDETNAFQIKEAIEGYDGGPDQLPSLYKIFLSLSNNLVKRNDGAVSTSYIFHATKNANEKLKIDFEKLCLEKIQPKLDKAKETRDIKLLEEVIEQFEIILPLPEYRQILMEEYFNCGAYLKALSQAHLIFEKYPHFQQKIIARMTILENFCEVTSDQRKKIPASLLKTEVKIFGQTTTIEKLSLATEANAKPIGSIGKLVKTIPLEPIHSQYSNHPQVADYQPIEPLFTRTSIIFNGSAYLANYSIKKNEVDWDYHSKGEYKKDSENGPHQKRFITEHSGNQLFMFTNRDYSGQKSVKSFDLKGNLLWDMSDQAISLIEEPICTPIASQGKLFGLSYSNRETINTVNYSVYDSSTGKLISRTPISYLPTSYTDETCRRRGLSWNTYTHDKHFTQDDTYVYGYTGSGIIFKADSNSGNLLWEKGYQKSAVTSEEYYYWNTFGSAPSGYIFTYEDTLLCYMPDIQIFTGLNKKTGEYIWRSSYYNPRFIHAREKTNALYFSSANFASEPIIYKVNPQNGETIWSIATNGLAITGEGDVVGDKLYIPSEKCVLEYNTTSGKLTNILPLSIQPVKIKCSNENTVILTVSAAYIFQNDGEFNTSTAKEALPSLTVSKIFEPDAPSITTLSFENLNIETTLKIPEGNYTSQDPWKRTQLVKTSKPFHFLLKCRDNLTLFREGYYQKNGLYIPPEVIWSGQYPYYDIYEDTLFVSENGKITASNLFTRETIWTLECDRIIPAIRYTWNKASPVIAVTKQYIAYQTENQSIRVLDSTTHNLVLEFYSPSIGILRMEGNYIVTSNGSGPVRCYDISQNGKEIWSQTYDHYCDLFMENGMLVFVRTNAGIIGFYDLKTGALKVQASGGSSYIMNRWKLDDNILFAHGKLYDAKTGNKLEKYQAGTVVVGGGYVGFFKMCGQEGNYIENGKEYLFKTRGGFSGDNYLFTAIRKGNRITFFSFYFTETFEIQEGKLVSIDFTSVTAGTYGNHGFQANMDLFVLDNSLLEIRKEDMYFYRNFDNEFNYEKINSFRIENKRKFNWPYSELYSETEVTEKNWISYYGQKPKRKLAYQAFGDENFAYLKFNLSANSNKENSSTLYISADGVAGKISIIWDVDNWNNAQSSFNVNKNTDSWKETDIQGNVSLYIKIRLVGAFPNQFKNTLPNFNIELRQMTGSQNDGAYRIGGAYHGVIGQLPWLNYTNNEAQSLKDFSLRTALYENKVNFYPQGNDLIIWLKDRRKLKGIDSNIQILNNMLEKNAKNYCSVNILTALLLEEIQYLKANQQNMNEVSEDFSQKVMEIVNKLNKLATGKGVSKEWVDFALSFWTIEVFPYKFSYDANRNIYTKPYYGVSIIAGKTPVAQASFWGRANILAPHINQPFIEWVMPGLMAHFPQFQDLNSISFESFGVQKTGLGKIIAYSPVNMKELCSRKGKFNDPSFKFLKDGSAPLTVKENFYYYNGQKYDCFKLDHDFPVHNISMIMPNLKSPAILKTSGQTAESIMYALENLPADNANGMMMIDNYLTLSGKTEDAELIKVYGKWLNSLKDNSQTTYNALNSIVNKNKGRKDVFDFIGNIIKDAKLSLTAPRRFYIDRRNIFSNKESRSVLGPIFKDLTTKPETDFTPMVEYKTIDTVHKFNDVLEPKKGGYIYVASKISVESSEKAFLFVRAFNNYATAHTTSLFSIWLNGKQIVLNVPFLNYDDDTFFQKITLNKGENIILVKINGIDNYGWGDNYSICVGDVYGAPIKGIEMKPVHK